MNFLEFELLTKKLLEKRLLKSHGSAIEIDHHKVFKSTSGDPYEVDLSFTLDIGGIHYLTAIECKCWNSYVSRDKIGTLKSMADDIGAHKAILATTCGFQSGAISFAKSKGIGLMKITNDNSIEDVSHFDGGLATIEKELILRDIYDVSKPISELTLISPQMGIMEFINNQYGSEIANFLTDEFMPGMLDLEDIPIAKSAKDQLVKIPDSWSSHYNIQESGGLNFRLTNEMEIRYWNLIISMMKMKI